MTCTGMSAGSFRRGDDFDDEIGNELGKGDPEDLSPSATICWLAVAVHGHGLAFTAG
jgi:hypothetical protein